MPGLGFVDVHAASPQRRSGLSGAAVGEQERIFTPARRVGDRIARAAPLLTNNLDPAPHAAETSVPGEESLIADEYHAAQPSRPVLRRTERCCGRRPIRTARRLRFEFGVAHAGGPDRCTSAAVPTSQCDLASGAGRA